MICEGGRRGYGKSFEAYIEALIRDMLVSAAIASGEYIIFQNELKIKDESKRKEYQKRKYIARVLAWKPEEEGRMEAWISL